VGLYSWRFGAAGNEHARDFTVTEDGVVVAYTKVVGGFDDIFLVKLAFDGARVWERTMGGSDADWPTAVSAIPAGGVVVSGHTRSFNEEPFPTGRYSREWIIKLDDQGDEEWSILGPPNGISTGPGRYDYRGIMDPPVFQDGDLLQWVRAKQDEGEDSLRYEWVELSADGTDRSVANLPAPNIGASGSVYYREGEVLQASDGSLFLCGDRPDDIFGSQAYIQHLLTDGTSDWTVEPFWLMGCMFAAQLSNASVLVGGQTDSGWHIMVLISPEGNEVGRVHYDYYDAVFTDATVTTGGFAVLGVDATASPSIRALFTFDNELTELSRRGLFGAADGRFHLTRIEATEDGGFLLLGHHSIEGPGGDYDLVLIKTDARGDHLPLRQLDWSD
jgi:hypothetical protein